MSSGVSESKLHLWRSAIALAYCDHHLSDAEQQRLHNFFQHQPFSDEQKAQLDSDLKHGIALEETFPLITDKLDRAHLINISRVLSFADGAYCEKEQAAFDAMMAKHLPSIDLDVAKNEAKIIGDQLEKDGLFAEKKRNPIDMLADYITDFFVPRT